MPEDRPRPGHGTVFLRENRDGTWWASWQDDGPPPAVEDLEGSREDAVAWALARPAQRVLIYDFALDDYVEYSDEAGGSPRG